MTMCLEKRQILLGSFQTLRVSVDVKMETTMEREMLSFQTLRVSVDVNVVQEWAQDNIVFPDTTCIG